MKTTTLALSEDTISNLDQVADHMGTTPDVLAGKAIRRFLREEAEVKVRIYRTDGDRSLWVNRVRETFRRC